jgi:hypothetical protein
VRVDVIELRRITGGKAETLVVSSHPVLVRAVREAWTRLVFDELHEQTTRDERSGEALR